MQSLWDTKKDEAITRLKHIQQIPIILLFSSLDEG